MTNYQLPPKGDNNQAQKNESRKSNFTILSSDANLHPNGVNSELAGNALTAYGSKEDLTQFE